MNRQHEQDIIERLQALGRIEPDRTATDAALQRVRQRLNQPKSTGAPLPSHTRRRVLLSLALAAGLAALLALPLVRTSGTVAFGEVVRTFNSLRYVRFTTVINGDESQQSRTMLLNRRWRRTEHHDGRIDIFDRQSGEVLTLYPDQRRAIRRFDILPREDWFDVLNRLGDEDVSERHEVVGEDGSRQIVFQFGQGANHRAWVDAESKRLARWEWKSDTDSSVMHRDFDYAEELSESLFSLATPPGYEEVVEGPRLQAELQDEARQSPVLSDQGIGPARFGMSAAEVLQVFGQPDALDDKTQLYRYPSRGIDLLIGPPLGLYGAICRTQAADPYRIRDFSGRTDRGIRMGATEDDILRAYGEPDQRSGTAPNLTLQYRNPSIAFSLIENKLVQIQVSRQ